MEFGSLFDSIMTKGKATLDEYAICSVNVPDAEKKALDYICTCTKDKFEDLSKEYIYDRCMECEYQKRWSADAKYEHLKPYSSYYNIKQSGKKIISEQDWLDAIQMWKVFREDPYLKTLFGTKNTKDIEYIYQAKFKTNIFVEEVGEIEVRIMPDLLVVNHIDKTVQPVDLKTSSVPAYDFAKNFLMFRYDIQAALYVEVLRKIMDSDEDYKDYTILPFLFTDISRSDKVPVTFVYDSQDESQINGLSFTDASGERTFTYKNWRTLVKEISQYEQSQAKVPSYICTDRPNDLLSLLSKR